MCPISKATEDIFLILVSEVCLMINLFTDVKKRTSSHLCGIKMFLQNVMKKSKRKGKKKPKRVSFEIKTKNAE